MNYGDGQRRIRDVIGALSGELDTEIKDWILQACEDITAERLWWWRLKSGTFLARGRLTGTASWTKGTTTIALDTGAPATQALGDEYVNGLITIGENVYVVSSWDQTAPDVTVATEIIDTTGVATDFTWIQDMNTMPLVVESVFSVRDMLTPRPIFMLSDQDRRRLYPNPFNQIGGLPREAWQRGVDLTGGVELGLYPPPTDDRIYFFEYYQAITLPSADGDKFEVTPGIPVNFHGVIIAKAKSYAFEHQRESQSLVVNAQTEFELGMRKMRAQRGPLTGANRQVESDLIHRPFLYDNPDIREPA